MTLEHVDIVFENCEVASVKKKDILHLFVTDIKESIFVDNYTEKIDFCEKIKMAEKISLLLRPSANVKCDGLHNQRLFDRIAAFNDVTHLDVFYEDGSHDYIAVNWKDGATELENCLQRAEIVEGYLILTIGDRNETD